MPAQDVLVSTDWVAQHGSDPGIKLVEVDVDTNAYDEGHIAGAIGFNWTSQLQDQVRRDILSRADVEKLLGEAGIGNDDTIVLYGDNNNWFAAYAFWMLEMYGHPKLKLMDGGRKKWLDEGKPVSKEATKATPTTYKASEANLGLLLPNPDGRTAQLCTSPERLFTRLTVEFNTHLAVHAAQVAATHTNYLALIHAQPRYLTFLSHVPAYADERTLNRHIFRWQAETIAVLPDGYFYGRVKREDVPELIDAFARGERVERLVLEEKDFLEPRELKKL